ncbi:ExbD/TolR family protein [Campylobacter sp. LH-2024]|uniref:ExbD/TolR family protein n=1 Tax=Campylobacter molothri TaxID=1032242 RepID=A0ACC5W1E7_9BACT|nr:ExbD/TolR family protein [Campylobacter sp. 2018MI35]MBZ7928494.1 ExbD/TolR family protein [Campylobacter sp. RM10542]MBZ7929923.1 ExbD/TolR family protein [Campylobacter sp. W0067]MBZ7931379.1 ExbD/TolR family protein [Campylobacter sp. RM12910]MBZ7932959.1 ExbD/TolR family protein [Campylobacter sp. RM10543]MBZ7936070.1 ExbD/TolR family protein [Campylobacter sp. B0100352/1]MBZ7937421.1 ExbD/TolR family protein [Campylobacter sp. RM10538]MBZ7940881.1 ExbD/TolR family protein [Campylobac
MLFEEHKPELNITPLVDIMLVLLAILMVTAPSITYEEKINLPQGSQKSTSAPTVKSLIVSINSKKEIFLNQEKYNFVSFADNLAQKKSQFNTDEPVFIRADKNLKYDDVIYVLRSIKNLGFTKVALQTE